MAKSIGSFGIQVASEAVEQHSLLENATMLDYDVILFRPNIDGFRSSIYEDEYRGKPCLDDRMSIKLREACDHWTREIIKAGESGKTVFIFLAEKQIVYAATGRRNHSGTGRNAVTTNIVEPLSNYNMLPIEMNVTNVAGSSIRLTDAGARWLAPHWSEVFSSASYKAEVSVESPDRLDVWLTPKAASLALGGVVSTRGSASGLILLPDLDFERAEFVKEVGGEATWSDTATQFAARLLELLLAVDKKWRAETKTSPEPTWSSLPSFALPGEHRLQSELLEAERLAEEAQARADILRNKLSRAGHLRALLYENGKHLESAIIEALTLMGFEAKPYKDGKSEFDVVFERDGERLLGEAEGKDSKAINVDKLRQLSMNIHEDLAREEVTRPAKGVLFGNGFRFQPPHERGAQFTEKCVSAALSQSFALVATPDLFVAAQYLSGCLNIDEDYQARCRIALLNGSGLVAFPEPPPPPADDVAPVALKLHLPKRMSGKRG